MSVECTNCHRAVTVKQPGVPLGFVGERIACGGREVAFGVTGATDDRLPERECLFVPLSGIAMALRYAPANRDRFPPVTDWLSRYIVLGLLIPRVGEINSAAEFSSSILPNA